MANSSTPLYRPPDSRTHIIGRSFSLREPLAWLKQLFGYGTGGFGPDANFAILPEKERGSAILGASAHNQPQTESFDDFFFHGDEAPNKYLKVVGDAYLIEFNQAETPAEVEAVQHKYQTAVLNFLDFTKVLFLYEELQIEAGFSDGTEYQSFILNEYDPRYEFIGVRAAKTSLSVVQGPAGAALR